MRATAILIYLAKRRVPEAPRPRAKHRNPPTLAPIQVVVPQANSPHAGSAAGNKAAAATFLEDT
jgi:hypothetical protein